MTELVTDIQQATSTPQELVTKLKTLMIYAGIILLAGALLGCFYG